MKRRLFNIAAGMSLALCLAMCALWVRSYRDDSPEIHLAWPRDAYYTLSAARGRIRYGWTMELIPPPEATTMQWARSRPMTRRQWMGFEYANGEEVPYVDLFSIGRPSFVHIYGRARYIAAPA